MTEDRAEIVVRPSITRKGEFVATFKAPHPCDEVGYGLTYKSAVINLLSKDTK